MNIKSKLNTISCTFKDIDLEGDYMMSEWEKDKKKILIKIYFLILFSILGLITSYGIHLKNMEKDIYPYLNRLGTYWILSAHILNIILCSVTIFSNNNFRRKYANNLFAFMLCSAFLAINAKSFTGLDSEFTPGTMNFSSSLPILFALVSQFYISPI